MTIIGSFIFPDGKHSPLSNFYPSPVTDTEGHAYPSVEHYYQAMKTLDPFHRQEVREARSPGHAKRAGRAVPLRPDWEAIKYDVMFEGIRQKFAPDSPLAAYLLATEHHLLVEGNTWGDRTWGRVDGHGKNWLGTILMAWRCELRHLLDYPEAR